MRSLTVTLLVCAAIGGGALVGAWGLQAAVIPPASMDERVGAQVASWFLQHRLVAASVRVGNGGARRSDCMGGWFRTGRGTVLRYRGGGALVSVQPGPVQVLGLPALSNRLALVKLIASGCPRILGPRVAAAIHAVPGVRLESAVVDGRSALALLVPTPLARIVVYLDPPSFQPIAVWVKSGALTAYGRLKFIWLTPALQRRVAGTV